jgi:hypothetical protein
MTSWFLCTVLALTSLVVPALAAAAPACPPEVKEAADLWKTKSAVARKPRTQASARAQEMQAPRGQETSQAPRAQDVQAPRGQESSQAPRAQDMQLPRNAAKGRANALANARRLVNEAQAACKDADDVRAGSNARAALELLKYVE